MAVFKSFLQLFFHVCVFLSAFVHSRTLQHLPKTTVFDVAAARQKAIEILSFNPETLLQLEESHDSLSPLTVRLHSRGPLYASSFKTYRDLALSRLHHDSRRLQFIFSKLNISKNADKPMDVQAPVTSAPDGSEYYARFGFGTPPQQLYTTIDTGSDITWIQCKPCVNCYDQIDPIFDPSKSSSYNAVTCDSEICLSSSSPSCDDDNMCQYDVSYGDGSYTTGDYVEETLTLGRSKVNNVIGCGHDSQGLFKGMDGLLGLGRGSLSLPSQLNQSSFSYCLVDKDSTNSSLLEFGTSATARGVITAPLLTNDDTNFYYLGLTGISVAGERLPISRSAFEIDASGKGGVILDSGTTITHFTDEVYTVLRDAFVKAATSLKRGKAVEGLECFDLSSLDSAEVPVIALHFGSHTVSLVAKNSLIQIEDNVFCFAFTPSGDQLSIIGNTQQQGIHITYDVKKSVVGFVPNKC